MNGPDLLFYIATQWTYGNAKRIDNGNGLMLSWGKEKNDFNHVHIFINNGKWVYNIKCNGDYGGGRTEFDFDIHNVAGSIDDIRRNWSSVCPDNTYTNDEDYFKHSNHEEKIALYTEKLGRASSSAEIEFLNRRIEQHRSLFQGLHATRVQAEASSRLSNAYIQADALQAQALQAPPARKESAADEKYMLKTPAELINEDNIKLKAELAELNQKSVIKGKDRHRISDINAMLKRNGALGGKKLSRKSKKRKGTKRGKRTRHF